MPMFLFSRRLGVRNTRLLRLYSEMDPRVLQLLLVIRHWGATVGVSGAYFRCVPCDCTSDFVALRCGTCPYLKFAGSLVAVPRVREIRSAGPFCVS